MVTLTDLFSEIKRLNRHRTVLDVESQMEELVKYIEPPDYANIVDYAELSILGKGIP